MFKIREQATHPLEVSDSLRSQNNDFSVSAQLAPNVMLISWVNRMVHRLLYLSASPNSRRTQHSGGLTPKFFSSLLFFFLFFHSKTVLQLTTLHLERLVMYPVASPQIEIHFSMLGCNSSSGFVRLCKELRCDVDSRLEMKFLSE